MTIESVDEGPSDPERKNTADVTEDYIVEGSRIRASWYEAASPPASLSGMMFKIGAKLLCVKGTVRHVRGDHPTAPTAVALFIDPDPDPRWTGPTTKPSGCTCDHAHVLVNLQHVDRVES